MDGRFLNETSVEALRGAALQARADGLDAVFVADGPLGDPVVLAAALSAWTTDLLLGVRVSLQAQPHRHPTLLAREMTTLDHLSQGRAVLTFVGPFSDATADATAEAITLCRDMWRRGIAASEGPYYPVAGAINRPGPFSEGGPSIALDATDATDGAPVPPSLLDLVDILCIPVDATAPVVPAGVALCQIRGT